MGKIMDFLFSDNWEEFQRIQLYKKLPEALKREDLSEEQTKKIEEIIKNK